MRNIIIALLLLGSTTLVAQQKLSKNKKALMASVEKHKAKLIEISD